jgi:hypothetical protein
MKQDDHYHYYGKTPYFGHIRQVINQLDTTSITIFNIPSKVFNKSSNIYTCRLFCNIFVILNVSNI